jgi:hypothetical protein
MFNTTVAAGNFVQTLDSDNAGYANPSVTITNTIQIPKPGMVGYNIAAGTATIDHSGAYGQSGASLSNVTVTNPFTANPNFGSCFLWAPEGSPLIGAASDGGNIGATILYQYVGGVLTTNPLWDTTTGAPLFAGETVTGLNDTTGAHIESLFDIANRANINQNGCSFPAAYSGQVTTGTSPSPPSGLTATVQ